MSRALATAVRMAAGALAGAAAVGVTLWALPASAPVEPLGDRHAEVVAEILGEPVRRWDVMAWPPPPDVSRRAEALRVRVEGALRVVSAERWGVGVTRREEIAAAKRAWGADPGNDEFLVIFVDHQLRRFRNEAASAATAEARRGARETVEALEGLRERAFTIEELHGVVPEWEIRRMEEARWRTVVTWVRDALFRWKHDRALHERYGGVVAERDGRAIPLDAVEAWLREESAAGRFEIRDAALAEAFWSWYEPREGEAMVDPAEAFGEPPRVIRPDEGG